GIARPAGDRPASRHLSVVGLRPVVAAAPRVADEVPVAVELDLERREHVGRRGDARDFHDLERHDPAVARAVEAGDGVRFLAEQRRELLARGLDDAPRLPRPGAGRTPLLLGLLGFLAFHGFLSRLLLLGARLLGLRAAAARAARPRPARAPRP